jgi:glucosylceramidase
LKLLMRIYFISIIFIIISGYLSFGIYGQKRDFKKAHVYMTAEASSNLLSDLNYFTFEPLKEPDEHIPAIILDKDKTFQTIVGFGGALTDASAETFYKLPQNKQEEILTALFDKEKGDGFSLCRTSIHSCDFSSESYTYADSTDKNLDNFSIKHDLKYRVPFIKAAFRETGNDLKLFASPWSPPAWMKTNHTMLHGGKLIPEYDQTWADYIVKFVKAYEDEGIPIWGLTVQNEPMAVQTWESCIFTASEERDFVKNYLGPTLQNSGLSNLKFMMILQLRNMCGVQVFIGM